MIAQLAGSALCSRLCLLFVLVTAPLTSLGAQDNSGTQLKDYVGTYADAPGHTIEIVAGDGLFAVVDEAKYSLRPFGVDQFRTMSGQIVSFPRDAKGVVTGYRQDGGFHPRVTATITAESAALAHPRPKREDSPTDYYYRAPSDLYDGISVGNISESELGIEKANSIVRGILAGTYQDIHSVLLYQHGKLVLEEYFYGYNARRPHQLRSATKTIVGALAGIAIDRGAIAGVQEPVLPHMSYSSYNNPEPRKASITIGDFLSMSSGLDCNDHSSRSPGRETVIDDKPDWVKATLDLPLINPPGTRAYYCSGGVAVVGRLIESATQMKLPDYAQSNLFGPLGISRTEWEWNYDLTNADKEYSQIHMRPRDMLKFGILYLNGGRWQGRQVISESWVRASLAEHSHVDNVSYGYWWWRPWLNVDTPSGAQHVDVIAAQGNGGQKIYLVPQYDLVAVFTAGGYNAESTPPNTIMATIVLPALMKAARHQQIPIHQR
jgi:CubicO group peptidase (beta-lactamase class C family)